MATPSTPMMLSRKTQEGIIQYLQSARTIQTSNWNLREQLRKIDLSYMRESDRTTEHQRAKILNRLGDSSRFQNVTVPIVMPQVESAVTYQSSVFLTGNPIFGVVSSPATMDAAMQMETVIEDQSVRGGWVRELMMMFRDGFKYNIGAIEVNWERSVTAAFETDLSFSATQARPKEVIWEGNCLKRLDPYNLIFDTRVHPTEMHYRGEFSGYTELFSRIQLKSYIESLPDKMVDNIVPAFESGLGFTGGSSQSNDSFHIPQLNPDSILDQSQITGTNWMQWASVSGAENKIQYKDVYEVTTLYAKILPADFNMKVPAKNTPQVWKFVIVNNQVILYAERQTNAHGYLPILFCQPNEDGLGYQTKSLATNAMGFQDVASALMNSNIAARRRAISDRGIYDPSRVSEAHINSDNPSAKIPVRPAAYGKPVSEAYYPIPFRDDQAGIIMQDIQSLTQMANAASGQNPVRQGQFVKGNKTLHEFSSVMSNANGRDQMVSMLLEAQLFTPLKEVLKINILQFQGGVSLFNRQSQQQVTIDPIALRKAVMEFKVSDGLTPTDKLIGSDTLQTALQVLGSSPQLGAGYNLSPLFSYLMKTQGVTLADFEKSQEQITYEQAVGQWQQVVMEAIKQGADPQKLPPQPKPQDFGYNPGQQGGSGPQAAPAKAVENRTINITNNRMESEGV